MYSETAYFLNDNNVLHFLYIDDSWETGTSIYHKTIYPNETEIDQNYEIPFSPYYMRSFVVLDGEIYGLVQHTFYEETPVEQIRELEAQIEALLDDVRGMEKQAERIRQTQESLLTLANHTETYALALASGEKSIEDQLSLLDKLRNRMIKFDQDLTQNAKDRREKERQLEKLQQEVEQWRNSQRREAYTAVIEMDVLTGGELSVNLSYVVSGASWKPLYDLRFYEQDNQP